MAIKTTLIWHLLLLVLAFSSTFSSSALLSSYLDNNDLVRIKSVIELPITDLKSITLANIYYSLNGQKLISPNGVIKDEDKICQHLIASIDDQLENIYFGVSAAKLLNKCQVPSAKYTPILESQIKEESSVQDIFRASIALVNLGKTLESAKISKVLSAALKKDESLFNIGLALQLAAKLTRPEDRNVFVEKIGDVIVQADEVDGKFLQFEGGLGITANIILGIYQLATASNKPTGLTNEQALKFANYFLSRKFVLTQKGVSELLQVLRLYTNNNYHIPISVSNFGSVAISAENTVLSLRIANVFGQAIGPLQVVADSATRTSDKNVIWNKKPFHPVQGDSTIFSLNFYETKPPRGFYDVSITATPSKADSRLIGNNGAIVKAVVLTQIEIINAEISVADRDSSGTGSVSKLQHPSTFKTPLEADYQQKLLFKFKIRDRYAGDFLTAHQTFVRFKNLETKQEVFFVAEPDQTLVYKLDLNLQSKAKDFNYNSGNYQVTLIVGDSIISNPIEWIAVANIKLQFPSSTFPVSSTSKQLVLETYYTPKPEIKHLFREPEKRPPLVISNAFSILVLVPLVILLALWIKIGVNLSNFPFTISALLFHIGLFSIFNLYVCFFVHLDMFQTCKYLAILGLITFLAGHSLLSRIAKNKNK